MNLHWSILIEAIYPLILILINFMVTTSDKVSAKYHRCFAYFRSCLWHLLSLLCQLFLFCFKRYIYFNNLSVMWDRGKWTEYI